MSCHSNMKIAHAEDFLSLLPANTPRNPTWRILPRTPTRLEYDLNALAFQDRLFVLAKKTVLSTGLFGEDFAELLDVAQSYHWSLQEPVCAPFLAPSLILVIRLTLFRSFPSTMR